jgi:hypothetical protein
MYGFVIINLGHESLHRACQCHGRAEARISTAFSRERRGDGERIARRRTRCARSGSSGSGSGSS